MNKTVNCERCKKQFIDEEFDDHVCSPRITRIQEIGFDRVFEPTVNHDGDKVYMANGLNGILYRLVQCSHNPPHTNTYPTTFDNEEIRRRFDRTSFSVLLPCRLVRELLPSVGRNFLSLTSNRKTRSISEWCASIIA